jgi:hypothetical protein
MAETSASAAAAAGPQPAKRTKYACKHLRALNYEFLPAGWCVCHLSASVTNSSLLRYDLTSTFDVIVGLQEQQQQRFTVYTSILTQRSKFFRAARSSQWLADPAKPINLDDDESEVFSAYLNVVYFGIETTKEDYEGIAPEDFHGFGEIEGMSALEHQTQKENAAEKRALSTTKDEDEEEALEDAFDMSLKGCDERAADDIAEYTTPSSVACDAHYISLAKLYILADKLGDLATANLVIDEFTRFNCSITYNPSAEVVNLVYESTVHGNPLRRLM